MNGNSKPPLDVVNDLREDAKALGHLAELEDIVDLPPSRGGFHFLDGERAFIRGARRKHDERLGFTLMQRELIEKLWRGVETWKQR